MTGQTKIRYACTENDSEIIGVFEDGVLDEIHIGCGDGEHLVIGIEDFRKAMESFYRVETAWIAKKLCSEITFSTGPNRGWEKEVNPPGYEYVCPPMRAGV